MKLSESTIEILKNFATLNQSLRFRKGSELTTITPGKTVLAKARVVESFPSEFALYDLTKFLAKFSLYGKDCDIELKSDRLVFKSADGRRSDSVILGGSTVAPHIDKKIDMEDPDITFELSQDDLNWQRRSAGVSASEHMVFRGDGKKIHLQSTSLKDDSSDVSSTEIGKTDKTFLYVLKLEFWKMIDGNYTVSLKKFVDDKGKVGGLTKFQNKDKPVEYYIAVDSTLSKL